MSKAHKLILSLIGIPFLLIGGAYLWWIHWTPPDTEWGLRIRARRGDTLAMERLGGLTHEMRWFYMAAEKGDPGAYLSLGNLNQIYHPKEAFEYYRKGAEIELRTRKSAGCIIEVSKAYQFGLYGVVKNEVEADRLNQIASEILSAEAGLGPHRPVK